MITEKIRKEVYYRDREGCVICGTKHNLERTPHHTFFLSNYFEDDKNKAWNLCTICRDCHRCIHHASNNEEVIKGKKVAKKCREIALKRYTGQYRNKLIKIMQMRYGNNWKKL